MVAKIIFKIGFVAGILLIIDCFLPWAHYISINETFSGVNVRPFPNGNYYGRAGMVIVFMTALILLLTFVRKNWVRQLNVFLGALLAAYAVRTYLIFTNEIIPGEVEKKIGIMLLIPLAVLVLIGTLFPKNYNPVPPGK